MKIAAMVIDKWKLNFFIAILDKEKYKYKKINDCPNRDSITLKVKVENIGHLKPLVEQANKEAARSKMH